MRVALLSLIVVLLAPGIRPEAQAQNRWNWPEKGENLKVLPPDTSPEQLRAIMSGFARSLGVRCVFCHVGEADAPLSELDFVSDDNPHKETARLMYRMLGDINQDWLSQVKHGEDEPEVNMWCQTCHHGQPRPLSLQQRLSEVYADEGLDATVASYQQLRERFYGGDTFDFREESLNALGYEILQAGHAADAVVVFKMNADLYPESGNVWDSLGEGYAAVGDRDQAIACYQKAVELEPRNRHAAEQLEALRSGE